MALMVVMKVRGGTAGLFYCVIKAVRGKSKEIHPILLVSTGLFILNFIVLAVIK